MKEEYRLKFEKYRDLELNYKDFLDSTKDILNIIYSDTIVTINIKKNIDFTCLVGLAHLNKVLKYFLENKITKEEVKNWAKIIIMLDNYEFEGDEIMRSIIIEILHILASPEINSELTKATAEYYLNCLNSKMMPKF